MGDELGNRMKKLEMHSDTYLMPEVYFAIRIDGRSFSNFTERKRYEHPYDPEFKRIMVAVAEGLTKEFNAKLAYTQSDEISFIFQKECDLFNRRLEKIISTTASYASCKFSQESKLTDDIVMFDARAIILPSEEHVTDYLLWRNIDAVRNALNSWSYWILRKNGMGKEEATSELKNKGKQYKNDLLIANNINFNNISAWQKKGILLSWETYSKEGTDPRTGEQKTAKRRRVKINEELPMGEEFRLYIESLLNQKFK